jgi:hypothetical protein
MRALMVEIVVGMLGVVRYSFAYLDFQSLIYNSDMAKSSPERRSNATQTMDS